MSLDKPTLTFEVGFAAGPMDELSTVTFTDLSAYVISWGTERGRNHELQRFEPGTASLLLNNNDRRFDPTNTSSPYFPYLRPLRIARLTVTYSATDYDVYVGYIKSWMPQWIGQTTSVVPLSLVDAMGAQFVRPRTYDSPWQQTIIPTQPSAWYRLGESGTGGGLSDAAVIDSSGHGHHGTYDFAGSSPPADTMGVEGLIAADEDKAYHPIVGASMYAGIFDPNLITGYPFTVAFKIQTDLDWSITKAVFSAFDGNHPAVQSISCAIADNTYPFPGRLYFAIVDGANVLSMHTNIRLDDGEPHVVAIQVTDATTATMEVADAGGGDTAYNLVVVGTPAFPGYNDLATGYAIGNSPFTAYGDLAFEGTIDEFLIWNDTDQPFGPSIGVAPWLYGAGAFDGSFTWEGDVSGLRIHRLLNHLGWSLADRDIDLAGSDMMMALSAGSYLAAMQTVEVSEQGALFIGKNGHVTFHDRNRTLSSPYDTPQAVFGPDLAGGEIPYEAPITYGIDDSDLYNEAGGNRHGEPAALARELASDALYGNRPLPTLSELLVTTDDEMNDLLNSLVEHYGTPRNRVRSLKVHASAMPAVYPTLLALEVRDRVTVKIAPPGGGTGWSQDSHIEKISHEVDDTGEWWTTFAISDVTTSTY